MTQTKGGKNLEAHNVTMPAYVWRALEKHTPSKDWRGVVNLFPTIAEQFLDAKKREAEAEEERRKNTPAGSGTISLGGDL